MNKKFFHLHFRALFSFLALSSLFVSCARTEPTIQIVNTPAQTSEPATIPMQTETSTPPSITQPSSLVFPYISADAGNFALMSGETITFTWENAPAGADKYEFSLVPLNMEPSFVLGTDFDDSDGVAVLWTVPEHIAAELHATAYFPDHQKIELSSVPMIYSGDLPPAGVCSLIARFQPIEVYRLPERTAEKFALLLPGVYAQVLEIAPNGWYRIDASVAEEYTPPRGNMPDTGIRHISAIVVMNSNLSPASGDGWVNSDKGVLLTGSCAQQ